LEAISLTAHVATVVLSVWSNTGPLAAVLLLLLCSALISSSEVAMFSLTPAQKDDLNNSKNKSDKRILELLETPDREKGPKRLLATILIANNAVNIAIVLLSSQITAGFFADGTYPEWLQTMIDVVAITFVIVLFGEVIPKVYATGNNLQVARFMSLPLEFIRRLCSVTFGGKEAAQIMTPRTDIVFLSIDQSFQEVLAIVLEKGYSRMPVIKDSSDEIAGFLFIKDLLPHIEKTEFDWPSLIMQPFYVPENKMIDDLLQEFQQNKIHLAIVVDEYGGTSGLVTLEDILEEIVGEIKDEFDEDFMLEQSGRLLERGDSVDFNGYSLFVEAADKRKIKRVKVTLPRQ